MKVKCFACDCDTLSDDLQDFPNHFNSHNLKEIFQFHCHLCKFKCIKFVTLEKHLLRLHLKRKTSQFIKHSYEFLELKRAAEKLTRKIAHSDESQSRHDLGNNHEDVGSGPETEKKQIFTCSVDGCSKSFQHLTSFIMHGKCVHSEDRPFYCEKCSKAFKTSSNLNVHIKMHNNQRDHSCNLCPQSFITSSHLRAHLKIHLNERKYKCDIQSCGKEFIHLSSFKKHQIFHQGLKSHKCKVCDRKFSQGCHLRAHLKIHTNERNFICDKCSKAFRRPDTLRIHQKTQHES